MKNNMKERFRLFLRNKVYYWEDIRFVNIRPHRSGAESPSAPTASGLGRCGADRYPNSTPVPRESEARGQPRRVICKRSAFPPLVQTRPQASIQRRLAVQINIDFDFTVHGIFPLGRVSSAGRQCAWETIQPPDPSRPDRAWHQPNRPDVPAYPE